MFFDHSLLFSFSGEIISLLTFLVQIICLLLMLKYFGTSGLFVYMSVAVVLGNVQVMKLGQFDFYPKGVALGTVTFSTLFLCTDILNEYYGKIVAKKSIYLTFIAMILSFILMFLTLSHKPVDGDMGHEAMKYLFSPAPRLFLASLIAYLSSQMIDVLIYSALKKMTPSRLIWMRAFLSLAIAALFDNFIFSIFAWRILNPDPIPYETLMYSYVLGGYGIRLVCAIFGIPIIYVAKHFIPKKG
jgi:uncharacterized integral membrane protein (TIGR00697 family)